MIGFGVTESPQTRIPKVHHANTMSTQPSNTNHLPRLVIGTFALFVGLFLLFKDHPQFGTEATLAFLDEHQKTLLLLGWGLIVADLVLPVPATVIMAYFGMTWGVLLGGLAGATGSLLAGWAAYTLSRLLGPRAANALAGAEGIHRLQHFFDRYGLFAVAVSRSLPLLPEAISCLAGLSRMNFARYTLACTAGALPVATISAFIGQVGRANDEPLWAFVLSGIFPVLLILPVSWWLNRLGEKPADDTPLRSEP
jgi:uncharacterized membrane protein YdjX (TVP38/TMEM64 family)